MSDKLTMWTLFDHPADYPDHFVARLSVIEGSSVQIIPITIWSENLDELRAAMRSRGLTALARSPEDHSKIVEVWL